MEMGHGMRWLSSMIRLHEQGEDWLLKDIETSVRWDATQRLILAMMKEMCSLDLNLPWGKVRNHLVRKFSGEGREVLSYRPDPQEFWLQLRRGRIDESAT